MELSVNVRAKLADLMVGGKSKPVRPKLQLPERTEEAVEIFENASGLRCAWMNKIT